MTKDCSNASKTSRKKESGAGAVCLSSYVSIHGELTRIYHGPALLPHRSGVFQLLSLVRR